MTINDEFTTGVAELQGVLLALVGLSGERQNFDGNGLYVRFQTGGGSQTVAAREAGNPASCSATTVGAAARQPAASRASARRTSRTCPATQRAADAQRAGVGQVAARHAAGRREPGRRARRRSKPRRRLPVPGSRARVRMAIRKHLRDFIAIIVLFVIALVVSARDPRPTSAYAAGLGAAASARTSTTSRPSSRPPRRSRRARARRSTSPACRSARSPRSSSRTARPSSSMKISAKYAPIYNNATHPAAPEDRPEGHGRRARPGHAGGGRSSKEGDTIPISPDAAGRQPRRDPLLARRATRAHYLLLLLTGGGRGPARQQGARPARRRLERFEPTGRDVARDQRGAGRSGARTSGASSTTSRC